MSEVVKLTNEPRKAGRPVGSKGQKQSRLRKMARQLEKLVPDAIQTAASIMNLQSASETNRLKAAVFITDSYAKFMEKAQEDEIKRCGKSLEDETDDSEEDSNNAIFSSSVIPMDEN